MSATPLPPPVGAEMDLFLAEARAATLTRVRAKRRGRRWILPVAGAIVFLGAGATTGIAAAGGIAGQSVTTGATTITVPAPDRPATALRISITCLAAADYRVTAPTDPGRRIDLHCEPEQTGRSTASDDFILGASTGLQEITVDTAAGATYALRSEYVYTTPEEDAYPRNAAGQTYGTLRPQAADVPDLVFVGGSTLDGTPTQGYVLWTDIVIPADEISQGDPTATLHWIDDFTTTYPDGKPIPLYALDGHTVIGTYQLFH